jgi:hypothetical protein
MKPYEIHDALMRAWEDLPEVADDGVWAGRIHWGAVLWQVRCTLIRSTTPNYLSISFYPAVFVAQAFAFSCISIRDGDIQIRDNRRTLTGHDGATLRVPYDASIFTEENPHKDSIRAFFFSKLVAQLILQQLKNKETDYRSKKSCLDEINKSNAVFPHWVTLFRPDVERIYDLYALCGGPLDSKSLYAAYQKAFPKDGLEHYHERLIAALEYMSDMLGTRQFGLNQLSGVRECVNYCVSLSAIPEYLKPILELAFEDVLKNNSYPSNSDGTDAATYFVNHFVKGALNETV